MVSGMVGMMANFELDVQFDTPEVCYARHLRRRGVVIRELVS